jgi:archaellum biogenesis ATPase FlaH
MIQLGDTLHHRVEDLLDVLSQDMQHIEQSLIYLDSLRSMLIKQDEAGLSALLQRIRTETDTHVGLEIERQSIRQVLA